MNDFEDDEREIARLLYSGLAVDREQAIRILEEAKERERLADTFIFYADVHRVRGCLAESLVDEQPYHHSQILMASVPCGALGRVTKDRSLRIAFGALKEFVAKDVAIDQPASLVAFVKGFEFRGKSGIFLSPFSADAVHDHGGTTVDEQQNLWRVEFRPIGGDYVLGMFDAWHEQLASEGITLVLYIHKSRVMIM